MSEQYNLDKAVGADLGETQVAWNRRDLLLYAVGIGAKADELNLVYELDSHFAAFPTYPVVLGLKGASYDVNNFRQKMSKDSKGATGLPRFDPDRVVHGGISLEVLKQIPVESGEGWKLKKRLTGIIENKSGIIIENELLLQDPRGETYVRIISSAFNVGAKAVGKYSKSLVQGPPSKKPPTSQPPTFVHSDKTSPEQAIIYRLSGDYNPLHIEPSIGQKAGFGGTILHGLCSHGHAARAVLKHVGGNDPKALKAFSVRFTSPVKPGDTLETVGWITGTGPDDTVEVTFIQRVKETGKICLGQGVAYVKKADDAKAKL